MLAESTKVPQSPHRRHQLLWLTILVFTGLVNHIWCAQKPFCDLYGSTRKTEEHTQLNDNQRAILQSNTQNRSELRGIDYRILWGNYKPQYIHSISQRDVVFHNPLTMNMLYYDPDHLNSASDIRDKTKIVDRLKDPDDYGKNCQLYSWLYNDGEKFGEQLINDPIMAIKLTTTFVKLAAKKDHQKWFDVIKSHKFTGGKTPDGRLSIVLTFGADSFGQTMQYKRLSVLSQPKGWVIQVRSEEASTYGETEYFWVTIKRDGLLVAPKDAAASYQLFMDIDKCNTWDTLQYVSHALEQNRNGRDRPRFMYDYLFASDVLLTAPLVALEFTFDKADRYEIEVNYDSQGVNFNEDRKNEDLITKLKTELEKNLNDKILVNVTEKLSSETKECARIAVSNLLAGYSFNYGPLQIRQGDLAEQDVPRALFSLTPARIYFPRGFLWDEGFHNMISCRWERTKCMESIKSWFNTMLPNGWIPREQPRGREAYSYIPELYEDGREANPPTMLFSTLYLLHHYPNEPDVKEFLSEVYPKIKKWFDWFKTSQGVFQDNKHTNFFKWWGPEEHQNLGSGMDDFPRNLDSYISAYHVDAHTWVMLFNDALQEIGVTQKDTKYLESLKNESKILKDNLVKGFRDPQDKIYKDRLMLSYNQSDLKFSPHYGYPNLFPLIFGQIPSGSDELKATLDFIKKRDNIWSPWGLRSLSESSRHYKHDENYWRGAIWININFLTLRGLKLYYSKDKQAMDVYKDLRKNLIDNVCGNLKKYGYLFEHYDTTGNGKGNGNRHFSGWTSLIALIIGESYE